MVTQVNPDKKNVVRGSELVLDMAFSAAQTTLAAGATLVIDGKTYSQAELLKAIEDTRAPLKDVREARIALKKFLAVSRDKRTAIDAFIRSLRTGLRAFLGETNPDIAKFGFKAVSPHRKLTSEENALKAEKARRTREARHTMGARQKDAIRGPDLDEVVIHNPAAADSNVPAPQPTNTK